MITSSGFALRKIYEVEKIGTDDTEYTVPFSRDYRGIVQ